MLASVCAALLTGAFMYLVFAAGLHFFPVKRRVLTMTVLYLAHAAALPLVIGAIGPMDASRWLSTLGQVRLWSLLGFLFAWYVYVQAYFPVTRSLTFAILRRVSSAGHKGASLEEIREVYPMEEVLSDRVDAMVQSGLLERIERNGAARYAPRGRALLYGRIFAFLKRFWHLSEGG